jgi:hypothetical protein
VPGAKGTTAVQRDGSRYRLPLATEAAAAGLTGIAGVGAVVEDCANAAIAKVSEPAVTMGSREVSCVASN